MAGKKKDSFDIKGYNPMDYCGDKSMPSSVMVSLRQKEPVVIQKKTVVTTQDNLLDMFSAFDTMPDVIDKDYYPTEEELSIMEERISEFYPFLLYLSTRERNPETEEQKKSEAVINRLINQYTEFVSEDEFDKFKNTKEKESAEKEKLVEDIKGDNKESKKRKRKTKKEK